MICFSSDSPDLPDPSLEAIADDESVSPQLVELARRTRSFVEATVADLSSRPSEWRLNLTSEGSHYALKVFEEGSHLWDLLPSSPEAEELKADLERLSTTLSDLLPWVATAISALERLGESAVLDLFSIAVSRRSSRRLQDLSEKTGIDWPRLLWLGRSLASPYCRLAAEPVRQRFLEQELSGKPRRQCPVCGGPASLGYYDSANGARWLWCATCDVRWRFPRITCPFCATRDHTRLEYMTIDGIEDFRLDLCLHCHSYLRAIDHRHRKEADPPDLWLENIRTYHLGMVAEREGFHSPELLPEMEEGETK